MNTSPRPHPLPRPVSHSPSPEERPGGFPVRGPDAAAFGVQKERSLHLAPYGAGCKNGSCGATPDNLTLSPSPLRRLLPEEVPGFVARWPRHHEVSHGLGRRCLVDSPHVALTPGPRNRGGPSGAPVATPREASSSWKIISPLVTEALAAGYKAC